MLILVAVAVAVAVAATATTVTGSRVSSQDKALSADITGPTSQGTATPAKAAPREQPRTLSRSYDREATDPLKKAELAAAGVRISRVVVRHVHIKPQPKPKPAVHHRAAAPRPVAQNVVTSGDPRTIASAMVSSFGWSSDQFGCLESLWDRESGWSTYAENPSSGAYGIPQALPGSKMASAGADWRTNPATQIRWGLGYIRDTYGSPCGAWAHSQSSGWY
jgi:hypothetical protein